MGYKIKEKVLKDMFPDKQFIFMKKNGVTYISNDAVEVLVKHEKDLTLAEVKKTHVTNKFMIEKLKEQKKVDMLEVGKVIDEVFPVDIKEKIDKLIEEKNLPKDFVFQEKYFYLALKMIEEELKKELGIK